jgi:D-amino-acid oxidase
MPVYLAYLQRRLADAGTVVEIRRVTSLAEPAAQAPVVVNCTGIGARHVVPDRDLMPLRGQLVVVENPGLTEFFVEDTGSSPYQCYIYPHGSTVVLGGVALRGQWSLEPDEAVAAGILARCVEVEPRLRGVRVIGHRVGLRPGRTRVRLAEERIGGARVIHNYGHGRAGVSLSWGCAEEVAQMVGSGR